MLDVICISIGYTDDHLNQTPYNNVVFKNCMAIFTIPSLPFKCHDARVSFSMLKHWPSLAVRIRKLEQKEDERSK